jgi:hypothetical protein
VATKPMDHATRDCFNNSYNTVLGDFPDPDGTFPAGEKTAKRILYLVSTCLEGSGYSLQPTSPDDFLTSCRGQKNETVLDNIRASTKPIGAATLAFAAKPAAKPTTRAKRASAAKRTRRRAAKASGTARKSKR